MTFNKEEILVAIKKNKETMAFQRNYYLANIANEGAKDLAQKEYDKAERNLLVLDRMLRDCTVHVQKGEGT